MVGDEEGGDEVGWDEVVITALAMRESPLKD